MLSDLRDLTTAVLALPPAARPRRRPRRRVGGPARRRAASAAVVEREPGPPGARRRRRLRAGGARRHRPAGLRVRGPHGRRPPGRRRRATRCPTPDGAITHLFPTPAALAELAGRDPRRLRHAGRPARAPWSRWPRRSTTATSSSTPAPTPTSCAARWCALPGIGPWTAEYVAMRALRDPDAFMPTDLGIRRAAPALGLPDDPARLVAADRGLAAVAQLRHGAPVGAPRPGPRRSRPDH